MDLMVVADRLAERHFTAQHEAAAELQRLDIASLSPFLRGLLFTDGTVSRALEAQMLSPVAVEPVEQLSTSPPARVARWLELQDREDCIRRRVVMTSEGTSLSVWAESHVVEQRLPVGFVGVLGGSPTGIGGSLGQLKLESWRELLWFGLGSSPPWSAVPRAAETLTRSYRIITQGRPALLISEAFAVEMHAGQYELMGSGARAAGSTNGATSGSI
jgi:chorismate-pyruvate lyase